MELKEQIPHLLKINTTESNMHVQYPDQPRSCNNCGHTGHKMRYCNQNTKEFRNVIDINESDIIGIENERKKTDEEGNEDSDDDDEDNVDDNEDIDYDTNNNNSNIEENEMNISSNDIDIHIDPSQTKNSFECSVCGYTCKYEHIFKEHIQTHTGEKAFWCYVCDCESNDSRHMKIHMQTHSEETTEKLLVCVECNYKCLNKDIFGQSLKNTQHIYM